MQTSEDGITFIKKNEGLCLTVKPDVGRKMIGYGHDLLPGESYPEGITGPEADALLRTDVVKWDRDINRLGLTLTQNQHDALSDFTHNLGRGALNQLLAHGVDQVPVQIVR